MVRKNKKEKITPLKLNNQTNTNKSKKRKSLRISIITFFVSLFLISQVTLCFFIIFVSNKATNTQIQNYHEKSINDTKKLLEDTTNMAINTVETIYNEFLLQKTKYSGNNTDDLEKEYQNKALTLLRSYRFSGVNGYFYVYDYDGINIAHPIQPHLEGKNLWEMKDPNGVMVIQELINVAKSGGGFVNFIWNKPDISKEVDKIGYAEGFDTWLWMIGTGLYIDDIENEIIKYRAQAQKNNTNLIIIYILINLLFIVFSVIITFYFIKKIITSPLNDLIYKADVISNGDLTVSFTFKQENELGDLVNSLKKMVVTLKDLNQKIYVAVTILTKNLRTLYISSSKVKDAANTQAVTVEETQGNFENLNKMVETISTESAKADKYAVIALEKAQVGMVSMDKLEKEMTKIETSSQEITDIIGMINEIAEQTNLLSLNASIESARAGEAGKGFNIVAGEIRKLAEKSTQAANRIHKLITNNNSIIQEGVRYSKETTNILKEISTSNELISGLVKTISEEIHKVKFSSSEILQAIDHISNIAQDNLTESENVSSTMKDFVDQTLELQKFVGLFDVRTEKAKENHKHIEDLLQAKLSEANTILNEFGGKILPTGNAVFVDKFKLNELQIGKTQLTNSTVIVDAISQRTNASVTFFQPLDNYLIRVATTVRNFDDSRAIGTTISETSPVYQTVMVRGQIYFGRAFVVNRWYVAVYKPIKDETGFITGVIYLGLPETMEEDEKYAENVGIVKNTTFKSIQ